MQKAKKEVELERRKKEWKKEKVQQQKRMKQQRRAQKKKRQREQQQQEEGVSQEPKGYNRPVRWQAAIRRAQEKSRCLAERLALS